MSVLHSPHNLVVGAGETGLSCLRFLNEQGFSSAIYNDTLDDEIKSRVSCINSNTQFFDSTNEIGDILESSDTLVVSPGFSLRHPLVQEANSLQKEIIGDIEIFARLNTKPLIAVTGSNAKSTVVSMLHEAAQLDGKKSILAGNIGNPVLDTLSEESDLYILELSSFQLDTTRSLRCTVACILNISADHLDRYESFDAYAHSKQGIYNSCEFAVFNREDQFTHPAIPQSSLISFGLDVPEEGQYGLLSDDDEVWLAFGANKLIAVAELAKHSKVDVQNALAVFAIARAADISEMAICEMLKSFKGLEHRCEFLGMAEGVSWINDSKGTNVGATQAALRSYIDKRVILVAGGDAKGADVSELTPEISECVKQLIVFGKDADAFIRAFSGICPCQKVETLVDAVDFAATQSAQNDVVLLSPACSSLDMFSSYQARGNEFKAAVRHIIEGRHV